MNSVFKNICLAVLYVGVFIIGWHIGGFIFEDFLKEDKKIIKNEKAVVEKNIPYEKKLRDINKFISETNDRSINFRCSSFAMDRCKVSLYYMENDLEINYRKEGSSLEEIVNKAHKFIMDNH